MQDIGSTQNPRASWSSWMDTSQRWPFSAALMTELKLTTLGGTV